MIQTAPVNRKSGFRVAIVLLIAAGVILSFGSAAVPHYTAGYTLHLGVLFVGLLPYFVYGLFFNVVRPSPLFAIGVLLLAADLAVKIPWRWMAADVAPGGLIFFAPVAATVLLIILLGYLGRATPLWNGIRRTPPPSEPTSAQDKED